MLCLKLFRSCQRNIKSVVVSILGAASPENLQDEVFGNSTVGGVPCNEQVHELRVSHDDDRKQHAHEDSGQGASDGHQPLAQGGRHEL